MPDPPEGRIGYDRAVALALAKIGAGDVETRWSDAAGPAPPRDLLPSDPQWAGGSVYIDVRERPAPRGPEALWSVVTGIGGGRGWYSFPLAWSVRGWLDRLVGGVGLRRGRRDPDRLHTGDALDWWRVERLEDTDGERLLRLRAEMKVPGRAWLELTRRARRGRGLALPPARACSCPAGWPGTCTGGPSRRSTGWCSAAWSATSRGPPNGRRGLIRASPSACRG